MKKSYKKLNNNHKKQVASIVQHNASVISMQELYDTPFLLTSIQG